MRRIGTRGARALKSDDGYTLTEVLVVMAVIGLIAAVLTPGLIGQLGRARAKTAQMQLESISASVEMFHADVGRYPTESEGLASLLAEPGSSEGWTGPYLKSAKVLNDPWGNKVEYKLEENAKSFTVISRGRDGKAEGSGLDKDLSAPSV